MRLLLPFLCSFLLSRLSSCLRVFVVNLYRFSNLDDGTARGGADRFRILRQRATRDARGRRRPGRAARVEVGVGLDDAALGVDEDAGAVAQQADRAAARRLRRDVADHETVRRAAETAVGNERDFAAES